MFDHALHDVHEHEGRFRPHHLLGLGEVLFQDPPLTVGDLADRERLRPDSHVGEDAIGRDQLQQRHLGDPECQCHLAA